jgi:hypothetical protein
VLFSLLTPVEATRVNLGLVFSFGLQFFPNLAPVLRHVYEIKVEILQNIAFLRGLFLFLAFNMLQIFELIRPKIIDVTLFLPFGEHLLAIQFNT